jgi:hypothetical protein
MVVAVRNGECSFAVTDLATFYGRDTTGGAGAAPYALLWCLWQARRSVRPPPIMNYLNPRHRSSH